MEYRRNGLFVTLLKNQNELINPNIIRDDYGTLGLLASMGPGEISNGEYDDIYNYEIWEINHIPKCMR